MGNQAHRPALILIRHAAPAQDPNVPPPQWSLSEDGRAAARALAAKLKHLPPAAVVSSPEIKALETVTLLTEGLGLQVETDPAFAELHRPKWPFSDTATFEARVVRLLENPHLSIEGAEPAGEAAARFSEGLFRHAARPLMVGTHGTILAAYLGLQTGRHDAELWKSLRLPEALVLDAESRLIERISLYVELR
ncbi:histidine phosphatase family protein [Phenylobacterium ferrooxidans]|uniref:Phosphoglycerate mutase family protein n=1 Tax=Phenylobacterium ferrooxidans TaxID=2982689 RepID=A0ABW6CRX6_9CAUL